MYLGGVGIEHISERLHYFNKLSLYFISTAVLVSLLALITFWEKGKSFLED